jgi:DNA-binding transcriptional LysR family regulator
MKLNDLDLNLLTTLAVLLDERHVTRAAVKLGRSQPAVSNALHRLRAIFRDDLLIRGPGGLMMTPRAEAIQIPLREVIALIERTVLKDPHFDPKISSETIRLSTPDRLTLALVPALISRLQRFAPKMRLDVLTADRGDAVALLTENRTELAIGSVVELPQHLNAAIVHEEAFFCVMRKGHPLSKSKRTEPLSILSYPHVVVSATGARTQVFDDLLHRRGLQRNRLVTVENFTAVPRLLNSSNLIGVFTELAAKALAYSFKLQIKPAPINIGKIVTQMIWHARNERDQRNLWLREQVHAIFEDPADHALG